MLFASRPRHRLWDEKKGLGVVDTPKPRKMSPTKETTSVSMLDLAARASQWTVHFRTQRESWVVAGIVADLAALTQMNLRDWLALNLLTLVAVVAGRLAADVPLKP